MFGLFVFFGDDFVNNDAGNSNIVVLAQDAIQFEFVKRFSKTTIGTMVDSREKKRKMRQRPTFT